MKALLQPLQETAGYEDLCRQLRNNRGLLEVSGWLLAILNIRAFPPGLCLSISSDRCSQPLCSMPVALLGVVAKVQDSALALTECHPAGLGPAI